MEVEAAMELSRHLDQTGSPLVCIVGLLTTWFSYIQTFFVGLHNLSKPYAWFALFACFLLFVCLPTIRFPQEFLWLVKMQTESKF